MMKNVKAAPPRKNMVASGIPYNPIFRSRGLRPGAANNQSSNAIYGSASAMPQNKATRMNTPMVSVTSMAINLSIPPMGWARKIIIFCVKKKEIPTVTTSESTARNKCMRSASTWSHIIWRVSLLVVRSTNTSVSGRSSGSVFRNFLNRANAQKGNVRIEKIRRKGEVTIRHKPRKKLRILLLIAFVWCQFFCGRRCFMIGLCDRKRSGCDRLGTRRNIRNVWYAGSGG